MPKLLIIEDSPTVMYAITAYLESRGIECVQAVAISAARSVLQTEEIDLILLDLSFPDSSPEQTIDQIPSLPKPVIVLTAHTDKVLIEAAKEKGASAFIFKPDIAKEDLLLKTIDRVIKQEERHGEAKESSETLERVKEKIEEIKKLANGNK